MVRSLPLDAPSAAHALAYFPKFRHTLQAAGIDYHLNSIWKRRPTSFEKLQQGVSRTAQVFQSRVEAARLADTMSDWQLMIVQFQTLDSLQHRLWDLLDPNLASATTDWILEAQAAMRSRSSKRADCGERIADKVALRQHDALRFARCP